MSGDKEVSQGINRRKKDGIEDHEVVKQIV